MADMTVSGIVSGMDWEGMITQLVENAQKPAKVQMNKRTNLTNKKALFVEMQELTEKIQSSLTTLRLSSTYEAKKVELDRLDSSASAKGVLTAKVNADAKPGVYTVDVKQLAKAQTIRSNQLTAEIGKQALGGKETSTLWISNMGQKVGVEVKATDTLAALASRINNTIKTLSTPMNLTASVVDNRLIFKSDNTGLPETTSTEEVKYRGQNIALKTLTGDALKDGNVVITDTSGNKWTNGKDFDIVQGANGNEIRWRTSEANTVPPTYAYTAKYEAAAGDTYEQKGITRSSSSVDSKVLNFTPTGDNLAERLTITDADGFTYTCGTHFEVSGTSVRWISSTRPEASTSYTVNYTAGGTIYSDATSHTGGTDLTGGILTLKDSSGNTTLSYSDVSAHLNAQSFSVKDEDDHTYTYGKDFNIVDNSGQPQIVWLSSSSSQSPENGVRFSVTYTAPGHETFDIDMTRGNTDPVSWTKTLTYEDIADNLNAQCFSIKDEDNQNYTYGKDFIIEKDADDPDGRPKVSWLSGGSSPAAGKNFTVSYAASSGETFDVNMTRGVTDTMELNTDTFTYRSLEGKNLIITSPDGKTCYEGTDFTVSKGENGKAVVEWKAESVWTLPNPTDNTDPDHPVAMVYSLRALNADGTTTTLGPVTRTQGDEPDFESAGFTVHNGTVTDVKYTEDGQEYSLIYKENGTTPLDEPYVAISGTTINWKNRSAGDAIKLPAISADLTVSYTYADTEFTLDDGGSGLLSALGLDLTDEEHYTAAQDAVVLIDDNEVEISANYIDYDNDILKGVRLDFKGVGTVSVDISQDTDKAVEAIETFVESYNTLMDWINTRTSEKQVNTDYSEDSTTLSRNSDDFHTSWGLLYGNSYLRNTKSALRSIISQNYDFTFKERTSAEAVYGDMSNNGIKRTTLANGTEVDGSTTLRIKIGDRAANISITSSDTLETIAAKINDTTGDADTNEAWELHHDASGTLQNYVKAEVVNDKLVIKQGSTAGTDEISLSGTTALNALKMNTTYKGLYQIGIETTSDNYGMSGEIEFDSQTFLDALEENPEETEQLMLAFARKMDTQVKSMLQSSGEYSGTLKTEITNIETQITSIDEYLAKFQERLDRMEENLRSQYAAAEERISQLSQQASSISGILTQLSGGSASAS